MIVDYSPDRHRGCLGHSLDEHMGGDPHKTLIGTEVRERAYASSIFLNDVLSRHLGVWENSGYLCFPPQHPYIVFGVDNYHTRLDCVMWTDEIFNVLPISI